MVLGSVMVVLAHARRLSSSAWEVKEGALVRAKETVAKEIAGTMVGKHREIRKPRNPLLQ